MDLEILGEKAVRIWFPLKFVLLGILEIERLKLREVSIFLNVYS
jgi:hypothetical protein